MLHELRESSLHVPAGPRMRGHSVRGSVSLFGVILCAQHRTTIVAHAPRASKYAEGGLQALLPRLDILAVGGGLDSVHGTVLGVLIEELDDVKATVKAGMSATPHWTRKATQRGNRGAGLLTSLA